MYFYDPKEKDHAIYSFNIAPYNIAQSVYEI